MNKIIRKIYKLFNPIQGEIWCLHRVLPMRSKISQNRELEITPDYLETLIINYKELGFKFCSIDVIYKNKLPFLRLFYQHKFVNVSFDDGFDDVYTYAYPILKKYDIPFTLYLTTDFPDKRTIIWWILMENIILENNQIQLSSGEQYTCASLSEKKELYTQFLKKIFQSDNDTLVTFNSLFSSYIDTYSSTNNRLSLSWDQIKEMVDSGLCTVGSHSVTHSNLLKISKEELIRELNESIKIIEIKIQQEVFHFSYPHSFWNIQIEKEIRKTKFKTATLGYGGSIRWLDNKFKLSRNYITQP